MRPVQLYAANVFIADPNMHMWRFESVFPGIYHEAKLPFHHHRRHSASLAATTFAMPPQQIKCIILRHTPERPGSLPQSQETLLSTFTGVAGSRFWAGPATPASGSGSKGRGSRKAHEYRRTELPPIADPLQRLQESRRFRRPWNPGLDFLRPHLSVSRKLPTP